MYNLQTEEFRIQTYIIANTSRESNYLYQVCIYTHIYNKYRNSGLMKERENQLIMEDDRDILSKLASL